MKTHIMMLTPPRVFNIGLFKDGEPQQPLPPTIMPDQARLEAFRDICTAMCTKLLLLIGNGLGVRSSYPALSPVFLPSPCLGRRLLRPRARGQAGRRMRHHPAPPSLPSPHQHRPLRIRHARRRPLRLRLPHFTLPPRRAGRSGGAIPRRLCLGARPRAPAGHGARPQPAHPRQHWRPALVLDQRPAAQHRASRRVWRRGSAWGERDGAPVLDGLLLKPVAEHAAGDSPERARQELCAARPEHESVCGAEK